MEHLFCSDKFGAKFEIIDTKLHLTESGAAISFFARIPNSVLEAVNKIGQVAEIGALALPLELSYGKDLLYGEPIYGNLHYAIRGYANFRRKDGEYTYTDSDILATPVVYNLEKISDEEYSFLVVPESKQQYRSYFGAQIFIRYTENGQEKVVYSDYLQTSVYNEALKIGDSNEAVANIIDYCANEYKKQYLDECFSEKKLHVFSATDIKGLSIRTTKDDLCVVDLEIPYYNSGNETTISLLTDAHLNYVNAKDFAESNPAVMSTYEKRIWCCDGETVNKFMRAMDYARFSDKIVFAGDMLDYNSNGCLQLTQRVGFWNSDIAGAKYNKYPKVVSTLGNHEPTRQMEGLVGDTKSWDENKEDLQKFWPNSVYYHSETVYSVDGKNPVKIILFDDCRGTIVKPEVADWFEADLAEARAENLPVLLFAHVPFYNGTDEVLKGLLLPQFKLSQSCFCFRNRGQAEYVDRVYDLITENADIIKGAFTGHQHEYVYTTIRGTGKCEGLFIPQHIFQSAAYGEGYLLNIIIK